MTNTPSELWTTEQVAEFLGQRPRTIAEKRGRGDGPPYVKLSSRCVRYEAHAVRAWVADRTRLGTFEDRAHEAA
jgi:predicted DNA-binding transcriptional regulator AlpA